MSCVKYLPNYCGCFVCGEKETGHLGVRFFVDGRQVKAEFNTTKAHEGYAGIVHGGILVTLLDECMGWAAAWETKRLGMAVEITVRFLKPVPVGTKVIVVGETVSSNRRLWEAQGEIRDESGTVYAKGRGKYVPMKREQMEAVLDYLSYGEGCVRREAFRAKSEE